MSIRHHFSKWNLTRDRAARYAGKTDEEGEFKVVGKGAEDTICHGDEFEFTHPEVGTQIFRVLQVLCQKPDGTFKLVLGPR